ncbi:MAG TPA: GNAT family N-acetyltransferase [Pseudomonadales bacterium]
MLSFSRPAELRIPQGALLQAAEQIEFIPPSEPRAQLRFHVVCNGLPIGHARLERIDRPHQGNNRVLNLFDARHSTAYALKMIQVSDSHRNRGIGTVLLKEVLHYCRSHGVHRLSGEIPDTRLGEWFRRNGFTLVNESRIEFQLP